MAKTISGFQPMKNKFINKNFFELSNALLLMAIVLISTWLVLTGRIWIGQGDASQRTLMAIKMADTFPLSCSMRWLISNDWGPLHFIFQAMAIKMSVFADMPSLVDTRQSVQILSIFFWAIGIYFFARSAKIAANGFSSLFCAVFLAGLPALLGMSYSNISEIHNLAMVGLGIFASWKYLKFQNKFWIYLACPPFLASTMLRNESIIIIVLVYAFIFMHHKNRHILFSFLASSVFFTIKMTYALTVLGSGWNFLNAHNIQTIHIGEGLFAPISIIRLVNDNFWYFIALALISLILNASTGLPLRKRFFSAPNKALAFWLVLLLGYSLFLITGTLAGRIGDKSRYALMSGVAFTMLTGVISGQAVEKLFTKKRRFKLLAYLGIISAFLIMTIGAWTVFSRADATPSSVKNAVAWINKHATMEEAVHFDCLGWWEQPMLLYTLGVFPGREACCHTWNWESYIKGSDLPPEPGVHPDAAKRTAGLHLKLMQERPAYIVMAHPEKRMEYWSYSKKCNYVRPSHYAPYLTPIGSGLYGFHSFYTDIERKVYFSIAYENKDFIICSVYFDKKKALSTTHLSPSDLKGQL